MPPTWSNWVNYLVESSSSLTYWLLHVAIYLTPPSSRLPVNSKQALNYRWDSRLTPGEQPATWVVAVVCSMAASLVLPSFLGMPKIDPESSGGGLHLHWLKNSPFFTKWSLPKLVYLGVAKLLFPYSLIATVITWNFSVMETLIS